MKRIINYIYISGLFCLLSLLGCKKDKRDEISTTIMAPGIIAPINNTTINIDRQSNVVVNFEWGAAKTANNTLSFYKVVFDKETGDFTQPVYTLSPARGGIETKLLVSQKDLNKIAFAAGIPELGTAKIKWKVIADNGVVSASSEGIFQVTRPVGAVENPTALFVTGTATEGGMDLTRALPFKKLSDGVFEIYTSLNAGTFTLVDKITGTPASISIDAGIIRENATPVPSPSTSKKVYRINLDFNSSTALFTEITSVGLFISGFNTVKATLSYDAAGVWKANDVDIVWKQESTYKDERYKFKMTEVNEAGVSSTKSWGPIVKDIAARPTASTAATYYYLTPVDNSQYDFCYKFVMEKKADIQFKLAATADYTHIITYK